MASDPKREAQDLRDLARRARRLATTQGQHQDVERLKRYAEELETRASEIEKGVGTQQPVTQQQQVQQQQQQETEPPDKDEPK